jgi:ethanolamine-phosphate phospho-lyase
LLKHFPKELNTVLFCNSGSEATDLALRLSSYFNGREEYICLTGGYHGHVQSALDVSPYKWKGGAVKQPSHVHTVDAPDAFRGKFKGFDFIEDV